jgi:hypothetical protein
MGLRMKVYESAVHVVGHVTLRTWLQEQCGLHNMLARRLVFCMAGTGPNSIDRNHESRVILLNVQVCRSMLRHCISTRVLRSRNQPETKFASPVSVKIDLG